MPVTDEELLVKCTAGDEKAFAELYKRYKALVYTFVFNFVKSAELANDIRQEVFIKIWQSRSHLVSVKSFRSYLYGISRNHTLDVMKRAAKNNTAFEFIVRNYEERSHLEEELSNKEYVAYLERVINSISPQSRAVFRLCRQEEKTYEEVAELLGISRNAVKKHMVKAMKIIKNAVRNDLDLPMSIFLLISLRK